MKRYIGYMMMAAGVMAVASCTDFSDYNDASSGDPTGDMTLWDNISSRSELSDFAALAKRVGFDAELRNSRTYTVWAPANGSFDKSVYDNMSDSLVLAQFVYNHVAQYSHGAIGVMPETSRIYTLNMKSYSFTGAPGAYTYDKVGIRTPNLGCKNGVLHVLGGAAAYKDNIYQYLDAVAGCDSIRNYFKRYDLTYLDEKNSVEGPVIEGKPTWVDSVMITTNTMANTLRVDMDDEDSTYVMLMPNDQAYLSLYNTISSYYNYRSQVEVLDPSALTAASGTNTKTSVKIDEVYLRDSLTRRYIVNNLFYSANDGYNQWLNEGSASDVLPNSAPNMMPANTLDTLRSTTRNKLSNGLELLSHKVDEVQLSNGKVLVVDTLALKPYESYLPMQFNYARRTMAKWFATGTSTSAPNTITVNDLRADLVADPHITFPYGQLSYVNLVPSGTGSKTTTFYTLSGVRSTTYKFYLLMAPANVSQADSTMSEEDLLPNLVNATLYYTGTNGKSATWNFDKANPTKSARSHTDATAFIIPKDSISYTYLGEVNIPVCYAGLTTGEEPVLKLESRITPRQSARLGYDATMRVIGIAMIPADLPDNYILKL